LIRQEVASASTIDDVIRGHPIYMNIAVQYLRPRQVTYIRETLQAIVRELIEAADLDLESDPSVVCDALFYMNDTFSVERRFTGRGSISRKCDPVERVQSPRISLSTMPSRIQIPEPNTLDVGQVWEILCRTLMQYHGSDLQKLQWWSEAFMVALTQSTRKMPYSLRFIARETLLSLRVSQAQSFDHALLMLVQEKFPDVPDRAYAACIARLVFYRYLNPAILFVPYALQVDYF
jgi:Ras GTPase-activating-like protein IQGAP2/3